MNINIGGSSATNIITKGKTGDESVTSSTTLQDDDHLVFSVAGGETWLINYYLRTTFDAAGQIKVAINATGATFVSIAASMTPNAIVPAYGTADALNTGISLVSALATGGLVEVCAVVSNTTAGTVTLQWAQNTSNGSATTLKAGSYLVAHKL